MIEKPTVLFICIHIRVKSINYAVSIKFYDQSGITIVCMIYFTLQWKKEIRAKLESLRLPAIVGGHTEVYETWKNTLSFWLSSGNNKVYMATPFFHLVYLEEFLNIVWEKRRTANIGEIFVREECNKKRGRKFHEMLNTTINKYDLFPEKQTLFLREVLLKAPEMTTKPNYFHAKFIGCINTENEKAEVLLTSANFTGDHLDKFTYKYTRETGQNYESISYHDMSAYDFMRRFIEPLSNLNP